ncbi:hypothetical protein JNUCC0626_16110 [Lentzea sp. JNUCC 0626]|uniref:hypothetical protein n=1 Tax=Lentzea sp. JNUCC 0626 TaxID=3367513 RepID=UPI00374A18AA
MWGRRSAPQKLVDASGYGWKHLDDRSESSAAMITAYVAAQRTAPDDVLPTVARVAEKLLADDANHGLVAELVEDFQNLASHGLEQVLTTQEIRMALGPRTLDVWDEVERFWTDVAHWRRGTGEPMRHNADVLSVENEALRSQLWTSNRSLGDGTRVGLPEAVLFEKSGGEPISSRGRAASPRG